MDLKLKTRPKSPIIIQGFPGFGMVGAIAIEYLIEHLKTEKIGKLVYDGMPAMAAIHDGKLIEPFGIFYNKKYNIILVHSIIAVPGSEWKLSEGLKKLATELKAKEIICLEGVGTMNTNKEPNVLSYATDAKKQDLLIKKKIEKLKEGIIMGITSTVLMNVENTPVSCLFAEAHTNIPDSNAAAKLIEALDNYLNLKVDYKPLTMMAAKFEEKLKGILQQSQQAEMLRDKKAMAYVG